MNSFDGLPARPCEIGADPWQTDALRRPGHDDAQKRLSVACAEQSSGKEKEMELVVSETSQTDPAGQQYVELYAAPDTVGLAGQKSKVSFLVGCAYLQFGNPVW